MKPKELTLPDAMKYPNAEIRELYPMTDYFYKNICELINDRIKNENFFVDCELVDCQLILRSIDDLTDKEKKYIANKFLFQGKSLKVVGNITLEHLIVCCQTDMIKDLIDYLRSIGIDVDGFLLNGKAVKA